MLTRTASFPSHYLTNFHSKRNGAACGALFGARVGYSNLPQDWLAALPNKKWLDKKVVAFLRMVGLLPQPSPTTTTTTEEPVVGNKES